MTPQAHRPPPVRLTLLLIVSGVVWLTGCLIIPVDYHAAGSRQNINPGTSRSMLPGTTTKDEVFLSLGEPDFVSDDGQRLGYAWTKVKALWLVIGGSSSASGELERSYVLELSFAGDDRLAQVRLLNEWGPSVTPSRERKR